MNDSRAAIDIHQHMQMKLNRVCRDIAQACEIAELEANETIQIIMSALLSELIKGSVILDMGEADFVKLCRLAYRHIYKQQCENLK